MIKIESPPVLPNVPEEIGVALVGFILTEITRKYILEKFFKDKDPKAFAVTKREMVNRLIEAGNISEAELLMKSPECTFVINHESARLC